MSRLQTTEHGGGRPESPPCFSRQPAQQGQSELGGSRRQEAGGTMPDAREAAHASGSPGFAFAIFQLQYIAFPFPSASALGYLRSASSASVCTYTYTPHTAGRGPP